MPTTGRPSVGLEMFRIWDNGTSTPQSSGASMTRPEHAHATAAPMRRRATTAVATTAAMAMPEAVTRAPRSDG